jgi:hypothetical protein
MQANNMDICTLKPNPRVFISNRASHLSSRNRSEKYGVKLSNQYQFADEK